MTTKVFIKSPRPNHRALMVQAVALVVAADGAMTINTTGQAPIHLGDGQCDDSLYVHSSHGVLVTEIDKAAASICTGSLTLGQKLAGIDFNPSGDPNVANCKDAHADCIDQMVGLRDRAADPEVKRMASIAITHLQTAQMFAVKALTWRG